MKKLGRNTLAVGVATLLVTSAVSFSAQAADEPVAQANASASTGEGVFGLLDSQSCEAIFPEDPAGLCGPGLDTNSIDAFDQIATAEADGNSAAEASLAPIGVVDLQSTLDLSDLVVDLTEINTGTVLDPILGGLTGAVADLLELLGLDAVTDVVDDVLGEVVGAIDGALPLSIEIGEVSAQCSAEPGVAEGSSSVADIDLIINLGGQEIVAPIVAETSANQNLLVGAPQELVDGILAGLRATLDESLGGALGALNVLLVGLEDLLIDPLLDALEPTLLQAVSDLLEPVVSGTVNSQTSTADGQIEVKALDLNVIGGNNLDLGRVECGPNAGPAVADDADAQADVDADVDADADQDADAQADAIADADAQADADVTTALPNAGAPNLLPFWLLGAGLVLFGAAVLINERRRAIL